MFCFIQFAREYSHLTFTDSSEQLQGAICFKMFYNFWFPHPLQGLRSERDHTIMFCRIHSLKETHIVFSSDGFSRAAFVLYVLINKLNNIIIKGWNFLNK